MAKLGIIRYIDSAHGQHIHGHTFKIEIKFVNKIIDGMVGNLDFHDINPRIDDVISKLDKTYIDDVIQERATVENIAIYIIKQLRDIESLFSVTVWEGADKYVEVLWNEI